MGPFVYGIYSQEILHKPFGNNPMSTTGLVATAVFTFVVMLAVVLLFVYATLHTRINQNEILIRYVPFILKWKRILPEEIDFWMIKKYNPIADYGGWGVKSSFRKGKVYNVSGNIGLYLVFKNGKKLMVGTQKPLALDTAMNKLMKKNQ
jgi:hypothetical protein